MYKVIRDFADITDKNYIYHAGDTFPREGVVVGEERIAELKGWANRLSQPLIEKVEEVSNDNEQKATKNKGASRGRRRK